MKIPSLFAVLALAPKENQLQEYYIVTPVRKAIEWYV